MLFRVSGSGHTGPLPEMTDLEKSLEKELHEYIRVISEDIGERHVGNYKNLELCADYLQETLGEMGYEVILQKYPVGSKTVANIEVEIKGTDKADEIVLVGGHYDSIPNCRAANDNGTGVASTLALAKLFHGKQLSRTLRLVCFVNEEPPYFHTNLMGSVVCAQHCRQDNEKIVGMLSLETMGYYDQEPGSQHYPFPLSLFYPSVGNFIAFVGNWGSRHLIREVTQTWRDKVEFPSEGAALPGNLPGVGWSDHWGFWKEGYPSLMVTDTAPFRYPHYHTPEDTIDKVQFDMLARVTSGLEKVITHLLQK